ncbi:MAG: EipA family protein [Hyphomicrobium sp.]
MRRSVFSGLLATLALVFAPSGAYAAACTADQFAAAVDKSGAQLRAFNGEALPKLQAKLKQLKEKKGWDEEKALGTVRDDRTGKFDEQAEDLIVKIDQLGRPPEQGEPDCAKLAELEAAGLELLAVMKAKSTYMLARLDGEIAGGAKQTTAEPKTAAPAPTSATDTTPPKPVAKATAQKWATQTKPHTGAGAEPEVPTMEPGPAVAMLEPLGPEEAGYNIDEIREISRGFFGTISTELGSVLEYAFSSAGRPDGYVLGTEGGGAFLAGLRYGSGKLYMRSGGSSDIYWHGPSIGTDFGASGSRTMFLIYRVHAPEALYRQFTGIDGSAYFIGGVGITFLKGGAVTMAPIRTGLGFRLGANIGYIRFTPRPTWNPF